MHKLYKYRFSNKLNGISHQIKLARKKIINNKDESCWSYLRKELGISSRHHLLAWAFVRNKSYKSMEKSFREGNAPNTSLILEIINNNFRTVKTTKEDLDEWLKKEE